MSHYVTEWQDVDGAWHTDFIRPATKADRAKEAVTTVRRQALYREPVAPEHDRVYIGSWVVSMEIRRSRILDDRELAVLLADLVGSDQPGVGAL